MEPNQTVKPPVKEYLLRVDGGKDISFRGHILFEVKGREQTESYGDDMAVVLTLYETTNGNLVAQKSGKLMETPESWNPDSSPEGRKTTYRQAKFSAVTVGKKDQKEMGKYSKHQARELFEFFGYSDVAKEFYDIIDLAHYEVA